MKRNVPVRMVYVFLFLSFGNIVTATDYVRVPGTRSMAIGGNGATQSTFFNPALIPLSEKKEIRFHYFNRYQLKELGTAAGSFQYPNRMLPAALHVSSFGYDDYRETMIRVSAGKQINECWSLGVAMHYTMLQTELYDERSGRLSIDLGGVYKPFENLLIGMLIMNIPSISLGDEHAENKTFAGYFLQIGFEWKVINNLLIIASIGTDKEHSVTGNMGIEYMVWDKFYLRAGLQTSPLLPSMGVGFDFCVFSLDVVAVHHPVLGISSGVGLSFTF